MGSVLDDSADALPELGAALQISGKALQIIVVGVAAAAAVDVGIVVDEGVVTLPVVEAAAEAHRRRVPLVSLDHKVG